MTPVGHSLTGLAIGAAFAPSQLSMRGRIGYYAAFMLLANIPDLPIRHWGHDWYIVSHSACINLLFIAIGITLFTLMGTIPRLGGWTVIIGGTLAWLSHMLLDSFYKHGRGLPVLWPLTTARLALPLPWFDNMHNPGLNAESFRIVAIEFAFYFPLLLLVVLGRMFYLRRRRLTSFE